MKRITLEGIRDALRDMASAIEIDPPVADRARRAVQAMLDVTRG